MVFVALNFAFWGSSETRQKLEVCRYKHSVESSADSACRAVSYSDNLSLLAAGNGFGEGLESPLNIAIDKDNALRNFEKVLFSNLGINEENTKAIFREKIILYVVIDFDGIYNKKGEGSWEEKDKFLTNIQGEEYCLNFSEKLFRSRDGVWIEPSEISGFDQKMVKKKISSIISEKINNQLLKIANAKIGSSRRYLTFFSDVTGESKEFNSFSGPGFLAIVDGIEIPGMNITDRGNINIYSIGASDISE